MHCKAATADSISSSVAHTCCMAALPVIILGLTGTLSATHLPLAASMGRNFLTVMSW